MNLTDNVLPFALPTTKWHPTLNGKITLNKHFSGFEHLPKQIELEVAMVE